jgi:hypothetical protein
MLPEGPLSDRAPTVTVPGRVSIRVDAYDQPLVSTWLWLCVALGAWFFVGGVVAIWVGRIFRLMGAASTITQRPWLQVVPDLEATPTGSADGLSGTG